MRSSNLRVRTLRRVLATTAAAGLLLAVVGTALADGNPVRGEAFLEKKDSAKMTLILEDDIIVRVGEQTRIYDGDQKRISFATIPDPARGQVTVQYWGSTPRKGGGIDADRLVVQPTPE